MDVKHMDRLRQPRSPLLQPSVAAQVRNQPATFRFSGGVVAYVNVFQLVRAG